MKDETQATTVNELIEQIKEVTAHQKAQSLVDEVRMMRMQLNDPTFRVSIYDRKKGRIGDRCPREEAVKFIANTTAELTGLELSTATELADKYEFSKKDATFFLNMQRDFLTTYLKTGRKINVVQSEDCEASLFLRPTSSREKLVPGKDGNSTTVVPAYNKLISRSKVPGYMSKEN